MAEALRSPEKAAILKAVEEYVSLGWLVTPLLPGTKKAYLEDWGNPKNMVNTLAKVDEHFSGGQNIGIPLGANKLMSLDIDEPELAQILFENVGADLEALLNSGCRLKGKHGRSRTIWREPDDIDPSLLKVVKYRVSADRLAKAGLPVNGDAPLINVLETRGGKGQDVLPPSKHPDGHNYAWHPDGAGPLGNPEDVPVLPAALLPLWRDVVTGRGQAADRALGLVAAANDERMTAGFEDWSALDVGSELVSKPKAPLTASQQEFRDVAEAFGEHHGHDFGSLLEEHGYTSCAGGTEWLRPGSTTGAPGVKLMKDKKHIQSFGGDNLEGGPKDYFQAWAILKHWDDERGGPNLGAAIREAAKVLGMTLSSSASADADFGRFNDEPGATAPVATVPSIKGPKPKRKLRAYTPKELKARPPRKWLVEGFIPEGGEVCFFGPPASGKSFAALDLALCVALGRAWHGKKVQQGGVIYIAAEGGGGQRQRLDAYEKQHGIKLDDAPFFLVDDSINLMEADDVQAVVDLAQSIAPAPLLVVVDTLAHSMSGGDENSTKDMTQAMAGVKRIASATGASVMLIHHTGKAADKGARGSSALLGAMDTMLEISRAGESAQRTITLKKSRDSEDGLKVAFSLMPVVVGVTEDGNEVRVPVVAPAAVPQAKLLDAGARAPQSKPGGVWQQRVMRVMDRQDGEAITLDELVQQVKEKEMPPGEGRSRARGNVKTAVAALHGRGVIQGTEDRLTLLDPLLA